VLLTISGVDTSHFGRRRPQPVWNPLGPLLYYALILSRRPQRRKDTFVGLVISSPELEWLDQLVPLVPPRSPRSLQHLSNKLGSLAWP
jgi:hypothetical protein